jgi:hypothetical protein
MDRPFAADGKLPRVLHNSEFIWILDLARSVSENSSFFC